MFSKHIFCCNAFHIGDHTFIFVKQPYIAITTVEANAIIAAMISLFLSFVFLITSIIVENTITPPVTTGYCTEAGNFRSAISSNRLAMLFRTALPADYPNALRLTEKLLSFVATIRTALISIIMIFVVIRKSALSTQYSGYD